MNDSGVHLLFFQGTVSSVCCI